MKLSLSTMGQIVLGVLAMALLAALGLEQVITGETAAAGIVGIFLTLSPGIASGHAVDVKTLGAELAQVLSRVSSVTVDRTTTVTKSVSPPPDIPVHEEPPIPLPPAVPSTPEVSP